MVKRVFGRVLALLLLVLIILTLSLSVNVSVASDNHYVHKYMLTDLFVNNTNIINYIKTLSSMKDKLSGHDGSIAAARYIYRTLKNYGVQVTEENYPIAVPFDKDSVMYVNGREVKAYPIWPSGGVPVNFEAEGRGLVIHSLRDINGVDLNGRILFLPLSIDYKWEILLDPHLGVKAIIFYDDRGAVNSLMYNKYLDVPVNLPIGYVSTRDLAEKGLSLDDLNDALISVSIHSIWREVNTTNIYAYIPGRSREYKIVLIAHYDSWSPVVGYAPGAMDSIAPSYLLELARYFTNNTPEYDVLMLFLSGYYEGLEGHRFFVEKYIFDKQPIKFGNMSIALEPDKTLYIGIDLNYNSIYIAPVSIGYFYSAQAGAITRGPLNVFSSFISQIYTPDNVGKALSGRVPDNIVTSMRRIMFYTTTLDSWWTLFPGPYWLESEPFWFSGLPAFTLKTSMADKGYRGTPLDLYEFVNITNLKTQFVILDSMLNIVFSMNSRQLSKAIKMGLTGGAPVRTPKSDRGEMFADLIGQVMVFKPQLGQQISLDKAGLPRALVIISAGSRLISTSPWNLRIYKITDDKGYFEVDGLPTSKSTTLNILAVIMDEKGRVLALNDMGEASRGGSIAISQGVVGSKEHPWEIWTIEFNGSLTVNMVIDPLTYQTPREGGKIGLKIVRMDTMAMPASYYIGLDENGFLVVYVDKYMKYSLVFGPEPVAYVIENVEPGGSYSLYDALNSTIRIVDRRLARLAENKIRDPATEEFLVQGRSALENATKALRGMDYTKYIAYTITGLTIAYNAYQLMKSDFLDVENTATLFSVLLVFFAFIMGLYFKKPGGSPFSLLGKTIAAAVVPAALFFYIHPAMKLTANAIMTIVGFIMIILVIPALLVLLGDFNAALKEIRRKKVGVHKAERSKLVASYISFSYGVEYMKKRRLRTALTLTTLIVVVISIVIFTSVTSYIAPRPVYMPGVTPSRGQGILLQRESIDRNLPIGSIAELTVKEVFSGTTVARYWSSATLNLYLYDDLSVKSIVYSITALEPEEDRVTNISSIIVRGRWFTDNDTYTVIVPSRIVEASNGKIDVGSTIVVGGLKLRVIGVYDTNKIPLIIEADGATITPVIHFPRAHDLSGTLILPAKLVRINPWLDKGLSFILAQISIITEKDPYVIGSKIIFTLPSVDTYLASKTYGVSKYSRMIALGGSGFNYVLAPIVIASVSILGVLLGSIYERRREIFIYAALGLSPSQIGLMFIAEALAYALVATVIGYVIGVISTAFMASILPGVFRPNYSSKYVVFAIGATIIAVLSATVYPIIKASKMALPSLRRKWEYPTKPKGDEWIIPLPFKITSRRELYGALAYVYEYIKEFTSPDIGSFVVEKTGIALSKTEEGRNVIVFGGEVRLKPWHAGVKQEFAIRSIEVKPDEWEITIYLKRMSGNPKIWVKSNKAFIDALRKQLLLWRTLPPDDKKKYIEEGRQLFKTEE